MVGSRLFILSIITTSLIIFLLIKLKRLTKQLREANKSQQVLGKLNKEITKINQQLRENANVAEELAIARERLRLWREIHDTLGHTLTLVITSMKVSKIEYEKKSKGAEKRLSEAINLAMDGLQDLRRSVSGMKPGALENHTLVDAIGQLIIDTKNMGINVELTVLGTGDRPDLPFSDRIYRVCQEAITNSLRHGCASNIHIIVKYTVHAVDLYIIDDGKGCHQIIEGFGLRGMKERIKSVRGEISYGSSDGQGFNLHIIIPIGDDVL